jgi:transposase-like protein
MPGKRRSFSASFKSKVALDAIKGLKTVAEIAKLHQVHPSQVVLWKRERTAAWSSFSQRRARLRVDSRCVLISIPTLLRSP